MDKKSFIIYKEWATLITNLSDENAGQLIKAMCNHVSDAPVEITDPVISAIYSMIAGQLDKDGEKYRAKCERIAEVNKKRRNDNVTKSSRNRHDIVGDNDNDNDNDNKNIYKGAKNGLYMLDGFFSDEELNKTFNRYIEVCRNGKKCDFQMIQKKLYELAKGDVKTMIKILEQSIAQGWTGLFPISEPKTKNDKIHDFTERNYDYAALEAELRGEK